MKGRSTMSSNNKNPHLTDQDRIIIEKSLDDALSGQTLDAKKALNELKNQHIDD